MSFLLSFRPAQPAPGHVVTVEPPQPGDDHQAAIMRACLMLAEVEGSAFEFHGFGRPWHVDVSYDMSAFLEQIGELSRALQSQVDASVDLYSQGLELTLEFGSQRPLVPILCRSRSEWVPTPATEVIDHSALQEMLDTFVKQVARGIEMIDPLLISRAPFVAWAKAGQSRLR